MLLSYLGRKQLWKPSPSLIVRKLTNKESGPGSSVGIATGYGLDGQGSNPGEDEIFRPSRLVVGPTQSPGKWVSGLPGGKVRLGRAAEH